MGGIWVTLFSHLHVHVGLCRDIKGSHVVFAGQAPGMSSFSALQSSRVVRKINRTAAGLTETQHMLTAVRSLVKSSNASCNILYLFSSGQTAVKLSGAEAADRAQCAAPD